MLAQQRRCWANIETTSSERLVFAGITLLLHKTYIAHMEKYLTLTL